MKEVYLDNHSNTRIDERVLEEMLPFLKEGYGNPQSMHSKGAIAKEWLEKSRVQVASLIDANPEEIYFTSCASESNNTIIKGIAEAYADKGKHIIVSSIEHFSVLYSARRLKQKGYQVIQVPVDKYGSVDLDELKKSIRQDTILISIQHANPEIGTVQPIAEIIRIAKERGVLFHTDAVCTAGLLPVSVKGMGIDLLSFSSSRIYGPKGAAAMYIRKGVRIIPSIDGGVQEGGRRAGTEDIPAIVGFGKACELAKAEMRERREKMTLQRDRLIQVLPQKIEHLDLNGPQKENRLPDNVSFSVEFVEGEGILLLLDQKGISLSSGSACASKALKMSHVLTAIKLDPAIGQGTILMTLSKYNTDEDIEYVMTEFPPIVKKLRDMSPLYNYFLKTGKRKEAGPGTNYKHEH